MLHIGKKTIKRLPDLDIKDKKSFDSKRVVVTGIFFDPSRGEIEETVVRWGGRLQTGINGSTEIVIQGDSCYIYFSTREGGGIIL